MDNQVNNIPSNENEFAETCTYGLENGGIHLVSVKGHGKTRLLFGMARALRQKSRVIIFDGSEAWLYGFDKIATFTVKERDVVLANDLEKIDEIERYQIKNWNLVKFALYTHKDILFRLKSRKPSKRGFFIRQVVNYLDAIQRRSRETTSDNEAEGYVAYFIEEAQNAFNSRSTTRLEAEEFLTVFNEGRNQKEGFFTASQRLTDFSKTIRTKQTYAIGRIHEEDKGASLRRIEKKHEVDFSKLEARTWCFEGKTFESPNWKQQEKPYIINKETKRKFIEQLKPDEPTYQKPKSKGVLRSLANLISNPFGFNVDHDTATTTFKATSQEDYEEDKLEEAEDIIFLE